MSQHNRSAQQDIQFQMLCCLDDICRKYGIAYVLYAGTLLGAVRHGGFIPWDDDVDVIMLRKDYERFLSVAADELAEHDIFLQKEFSEHWPMFFSKLRKNGTTCLESWLAKDEKMHQGIFMDVFPADVLSNGNWKARLQFIMSKFVIGKALDARGYRTASPLKRFFLLLCRYLTVERMKSFVTNPQETDSWHLHGFFAAASSYRKSVFLKSWLTERTKMIFEGREFPVPLYYHELLCCLYGDYGRFPSEEEKQKKKHGILVDTEQSYEIYLEQHKTMNMGTYSRSIR